MAPITRPSVEPRNHIVTRSSSLTRFYLTQRRLSTQPSINLAFTVASITYNRHTKAGNGTSGQPTNRQWPASGANMTSDQLPVIEGRILRGLFANKY